MQEQTWDDRLEDIIIHMRTRQNQVKSCIRRHVTRYASMNIAAGMFGTPILLPGASLVTLAASILDQGPVLFQPMAEDIASIYRDCAQENRQASASSSPDESTRQLSRKLVNEALNKQVIKEVLLHYLPVLSIETIIDWLPIRDGFISASLNAVIAVQLTRRIGVMLVSYFENGQQWPGHSPAKTDDILRTYGNGYASIHDIPSIREVCEGIITRLLTQSHNIYVKAGIEEYKEMHRLLTNILHLKWRRVSASIS